jgi:C-terminal processing protease CtpA/Prc
MKRLLHLLVVGSFLFTTQCFGQGVAGIGISIGKEGDDLVVKQVLPGAPAALSNKIKVNDRLIAVAEAGKEPVQLEGSSISKVVDLIRGPKGSAINLTVARNDDSKPEVIRLVRGEVKQLTATAGPAGGVGKVGEKAPEIQGEDVDGKQFKLSEYRGKVVLIDFWGDW